MAQSRISRFRLDKAVSPLLVQVDNPASMKVEVYPGNFYIEGDKKTFSGGLSPLFVAPSTNSRKDVLVIDAAATLIVIQGVEAISPVTPDIPLDVIPLAEISLTNSTTEINQTIISDFRPTLNIELDPLLVTQKIPSSMEVEVQPGVYYLNAVKQTFAGADSATITAPTTNNRIDIITLTDSNTVDVIAGIENVSPVAPSVPDENLELASILLTPTHTFIDQGDITDLRPVLAFNDLLRIGSTVTGASGAFPTQNLLFDTDSGFLVTDEGTNTTKVSLGSHWDVILVDGVTGAFASGADDLYFDTGNHIDIGHTGGDRLTFSATGVLSGVTNIGGQKEIFKQTSAELVELKTLQEGDNITITEFANTLLISSATGGAASATDDFSRVFEQKEQTAEASSSTSDTPFDIPNLAVTVPLAGSYLVSYSATLEASVDSDAVAILDASVLLYNSTQDTYFAEGKSRTSLKFGAAGTTDLISKTRKVTHSVSKEVFVSALASDTIKLQAIHEDTFDTISVKSLHTDNGSGAITSKFGYLSLEKSSFFDECTTVDRILGQAIQSTVTSFSTSNTPTDVAGMSVLLPVSGRYRIHYGITCKATTSLASVPTLEMIVLLYDETNGVYMPEGRGEFQIQFGSETNEDLISANRYATGTMSKSVIISAAASATLKLRVMYTKPATNDVTIDVLAVPIISGYDGLNGYLSFEKMGNL